MTTDPPPNGRPAHSLAEDPTETLAILSHNVGFDNPSAWVSYAKRHDFRRISAVSVPACPDCGNNGNNRTLGQYIYYSTLIRLRECAKCNLIWSDAHLDPAVINAHFEFAYKDHDYFLRARAAIFRQLIDAIDRRTPRGGSVLDVGGGQGYLMTRLAHQRPDVKPVVLDISSAATEYAEREFKLPSICGDFRTALARGDEYDVVVMSDVLYYEPDLRDLWTALQKLVKPGGSVVIRVPNHLAAIRAAQTFSRFSWGPEKGEFQTRIAYFNPEHMYVLSRRYLSRRLKQLGFPTVRVLPSRVLVPSSTLARIAAAMMFFVARSVDTILGNRLTLTPAMLVIATRD